MNDSHRSTMNRTRNVATLICSTTLLCALVACSRAFTGPGDAPLTLAIGQSAQVGRSTVRVVDLQDSRCPTGVQCIWSGDVTIILAFSGAGYTTTDTLRFLPTPKTATYDGLLFQPVTVTPYPTTTPATEPKTLTMYVTLAPNL